MDACPRFSIVISVFNRPDEIKRCIDSCLEQTFIDFEIVVVDDCSTDNTLDVIRSFHDQRLLVHVHETNRGMSWARRTGHEIASGQWIVRIDSDHALLPEALERLDIICSQVGQDVGVVGACYQWDTGIVTPPFFPPTSFGYKERLQWSEQGGDQDYVHCTRREVFLTTQWPQRGASASALMELNIAKHWRTVIIPDILGLQYTDATNSYHRIKREKKYQQRASDASELALTFDEMLVEHGASLQKYAPRRYEHYLLMASFYSFLGGKRRRGFLLGRQYLIKRPFRLEGWGIVATGLVGTWFIRVGYMIVPFIRKTYKSKQP